MYCIQCGVKLADSQSACPLCGTVVFHPDIKPNDHLLESFIALYRSCPPEDQELVLATTKTLVDHLRRKQENSSQTFQT